jgi:hypothetical protein
MNSRGTRFQMQSDDNENNRRLALLALLQQRSNQQYNHAMNQRDGGRHFADSFRATLSDAEYLQAYQALALHEQQIQDAQTLRRWSAESSMRSHQPMDLAFHMLSSNDGDRDSNIHRLLEEVRLRDTLRLLDATVSQPLSSNVAGGPDVGSLSWVRGAANSLTTSIDTYSRALALSSAAATANDPGTAAYLSPSHATSGAQRIVASALSRNRDARLNPTLMQQQERLAAEVLVGCNLGGIVSVDQATAAPPTNKIGDRWRKRKSDQTEDKKPAASKKTNNANVMMFPLPASSSKQRTFDAQKQHVKLAPFRETWDQLGEKHDPETQKEVFLRQLSRGIR